MIYASKGFPRVPWGILTEINQVNYTYEEYKVVLAITLASAGYRARYANVSQANIAEFTGIAKGHISRTIKRLINDNVIQKIEMEGLKMFSYTGVEKYYTNNPEECKKDYAGNRGDRMRKTSGKTCDQPVNTGKLKENQKSIMEELKKGVESAIKEPSSERSAKRKIREMETNESAFIRKPGGLPIPLGEVIQTMHIAGICAQS